MRDAPVQADLMEEEPPRRRSVVSALLIPLLGLGLAGYLLFDQRDELAYWLRPQQPVELGSPGAFRLERQADNVLATIAGSPGPVADRFERMGRRYEIVTVRGTNVLVRREMHGALLPRRPGEKEPPPDQRPFTATGRLVRDTSMPEFYGQAFRTQVERGGAEPRDGHLYVLLDGELPRQGWRVPATILGLLLLVGVNGWGLRRAVRG